MHILNIIFACHWMRQENIKYIMCLFVSHLKDANDFLCDDNCFFFFLPLCFLSVSTFDRLNLSFCSSVAPSHLPPFPTLWATQWASKCFKSILVSLMLMLLLVLYLVLAFQFITKYLLKRHFVAKSTSMISPTRVCVWCVCVLNIIFLNVGENSDQEFTKHCITNSTLCYQRTGAPKRDQHCQYMQYAMYSV